LQDELKRAAHVLRHSRFARPRRGDVFNLDVHVAVVRDIAEQLERRGASIVDWTLSAHSWSVGRPLDPVAVVNERTWTELNPTMVARFRELYGAYLSSFRAFAAAYPPGFALLYDGLGKPTLAMAATRYEWPFTHDAARWEWLNERFRAGVADGWLTLAANNRADADYLEHYTGLKPVLLPGACSYTAGEYTGARTAAVICTPDDDLAAAACAALSSEAIPLRAGLGRYSRADLYDHRALVFIPYNVSIMSLFEHYAAGAPTYVPTRRFLKQLMAEHPAAVLSSISFAQVTGRAPALRGDGLDLNDARDPQVVDWYLDRADFYDAELMPLLRQFDSWSHLDDLLRTDDHAAISAAMKMSNPERFRRIADAWDAVGWLDQLVA
jgi:hypothetical protein